MDRYLVRPVVDSELDLMLDWAATEGWNPGADDAGPFLAADPNGILMGFVDGAPAACISGITYGENFSFLGFYICRPEFRGQGYGMEIWNACIAYLGNRIIGLDGVVDQQANYAKSGFVLAHRNIRYGGIAPSDGRSRPNCVELDQAGNAGLTQSVIAYDRPFFGGPRETFTRAWIAPPRRTIVYLEDNAVRGYGTSRACRNGSKIGPLFADSAAIAEDIFLSLTAPLHGQEIFLDITEPNAAAQKLAERFDLTPVFETARMYRGQAPTLPLDRIFGITTFELG